MRRSPLRKRARKPKCGRVVDRQYLAFVHRQPCMVHGFNCPTYAIPGGVFNQLEAHHVGRTRDDRRTVPLCKLAHQYHVELVAPTAAERREKFERCIAELNRKYDSLKWVEQ
jgi:hypothetical protein